MGLGHRSLKAGSGKSDVSNQVCENVTRTRRTQRKGQVWDALPVWAGTSSYATCDRPR